MFYEDYNSNQITEKKEDFQKNGFYKTDLVEWFGIQPNPDKQNQTNRKLKIRVYISQCSFNVISLYQMKRYNLACDKLGLIKPHIRT